LVKKVLFVCTGNMDRSPTGEALLKEKAGFEVQSAGTWPQAHRRVSESLVNWADLIFVMERHHKEYILHLNPEADRKTVVLDIPDMYYRNDPELIRILKHKLSTCLGIKM